MAITDPNAWSTESGREIEIEIQKCIRLHMDRDETARAIEIQTGIDPRITQMVWDRLVERNQEFFRNYHIGIAMKQRINRFNELLEQRCRFLNLPPVPEEQQMSMELSETAPQDDSPASVTSYENEAEPDKLPAIPIGFVGSEEVAGSASHLLHGGSLAPSSLEAQGKRTIDCAQMLSLQFPNFSGGGHHAANLGGPAQPSTSMAGTLSHLESNLEGIHDI